jgi:hypothetical protein
MADQVLSDVDNAVHIGGPSDPKPYTTGETIVPGMVVSLSGVTTKLILKCTTSLGVLGVMMVPLGADPDAGVLINLPVDVLLKGSSAKVWCHLQAVAGPVAVNDGDSAVVGSTAGYVAKGDESSNPIKDLNYVGVFGSYNAGHATDKKMVMVII